MSKQSIFYTAILLITVASAIYLYRFTGDPLSRIPYQNFEEEQTEPLNENATTSEESLDQDRMMINFEKEGNIVSGNPGLPPEKVFLIYEEPGSPALQVELSFNAESNCILDGQTVLCASLSAPLSIVLSGKRVRVSGYHESNILNVSTLESLSLNN